MIKTPSFLSNKVKFIHYTVKASKLIWTLFIQSNKSKFIYRIVTTFELVWIIFIFNNFWACVNNFYLQQIKLRSHTVKAFRLMWISFHPKWDPNLTINQRIHACKEHFKRFLTFFCNQIHYCNFVTILVYS